MVQFPFGTLLIRQWRRSRWEEKAGAFFRISSYQYSAWSSASSSISLRSASLTGQSRYYSSNKASSNKNGESVFGRFAERVKQDQNGEGRDTLRADVKKFEAKLTELKENEALKRAKEVLNRAKEDVLRQNEAFVTDLKEKAQVVKGAVGTVAGKVGEAVDTVTQPVRELGEKIKPYVPDVMESEVVKRVSKTAAETEEKLLEDTTIYQYGGFKNKELRERSKWATFNRNKDSNEASDTTGSIPNATTDAATSTTTPNPEAGSSMVIHKESRWATTWNNFFENNRLLQRIFGLKRSYEESNNMFVYFAREISNSIADRMSSLFAETEVAQAFREIQKRDPTFSQDAFMKFASHHLIPEILDALLTADLPTLRTWCSEAMYNVLKANFQVQLRKGHRMEGRVLDMRGLELVTAKLLDETPVLVLSFHTQQVSLIKGPGGEIVEGAQDKIENVMYVMALAREEQNTITKSLSEGWKLVELAIRDRSGAW